MTRKFSVRPALTLQGRKFDPDGDYVRRWVPELADVPAERIHEPVDVPGYPAP